MPYLSGSSAGVVTERTSSAGLVIAWPQARATFQRLPATAASLNAASTQAEDKPMKLFRQRQIGQARHR